MIPDKRSDEQGSRCSFLLTARLGFTALSKIINDVFTKNINTKNSVWQNYSKLLEKKTCELNKQK